MYVLRITWSNSVRRLMSVGICNKDVVVAGVTIRHHVPCIDGDTRVRRNYKNKYPDSLYETIWILYGAGIET